MLREASAFTKSTIPVNLIHTVDEEPDEKDEKP